MQTIFLHPYAGVFSAYGMGLAEVRSRREDAVEQALTPRLMDQLQSLLQTLEAQARTELNETTAEEQVLRIVNLKYGGTNSTLNVDFAIEESAMRLEFEDATGI